MGQKGGVSPKAGKMRLIRRKEKNWEKEGRVRDNETQGSERKKEDWESALRQKVLNSL